MVIRTAMAKKILITGGTGSVGKALTQLLLNKGHEVCHLSRSKGKNPRVKTFIWDVENQTIDETCIDGVDTIIHLAGAGIADSRWTEKRKDLLIKSRTDSIKLIYSLLAQKQHQVKEVISASASGYYSNRGDEILTETSKPLDDFLSTCCILWEQAVDLGKNYNLRIVKFRTGVVLDKDSGALEKLAQPIKYGIGSPLGNGKQWISWSHIEDVINMYDFAIENEQLEGVFNMSSPLPVTNKELTYAVAHQFKRPIWLPNVPAFILKLLFGEMSLVVLGSTRMDVKKIQDAGFKFKFPDIKSALKNIYE